MIGNKYNTRSEGKLEFQTCSFLFMIFIFTPIICNCFLQSNISLCLYHQNTMHLFICIYRVYVCLMNWLFIIKLWLKVLLFSRVYFNIWDKFHWFLISHSLSCMLHVWILPRWSMIYLKRHCHQAKQFLQLIQHCKMVSAFVYSKHLYYLHLFEDANIC